MGRPTGKSKRQMGKHPTLHWRLPKEDYELLCVVAHHGLGGIPLSKALRELVFAEAKRLGLYPPSPEMVEQALHPSNHSPSRPFAAHHDGRLTFDHEGVPG